MKKFKVALQLYSVRDDMKNNMDEAFRQIKKIGYDFVEFAGYFGKTAEEVKRLLEKHQLECVSVHQKYDIFIDRPEESVEYLKTIGAKFCAVPWMGREKHKGTIKFDKTIADFIRVGKLLKYAGITFLYHNHDFEFERYEGEFLLDWLYKEVPSDILKTEIDSCWVRYAGHDPAEYIRRYANRSPVVHLKDFICYGFVREAAYELIDDAVKEGNKPGCEDSEFQFQPLGRGVQNIQEILKASEMAGTDIVVVEQDKSTDCPPMEAAKISREYLQGFDV